MLKMLEYIFEIKTNKRGFMSKIAIVYGSTLGNAESAAHLIAKHLQLDVDVINVAETTATKINQYQKIIFGSSTWGVGDLQDDWNNFNFKELNVKGKTVAIFGMGDSEIYAFTYCDSMAKLYEILTKKEANIVGFVDSKDYKFGKSQSVIDGKFVGLALDNDNYENLTEQRIINWIKDIKKDFEN